MTQITDLLELTTVADDDELLIFDVSESTGNSKKVKRNVVLKGASIDSVLVSLTGASGSVLEDIKAAAVVVAPSDIAAGAAEVVPVTVTGILSTDHLSWTINSALPDGLMCQAWVSSNDEVSFKFYNASSVTVVGASYTATLTAFTFQ